MQIYHTTWQRQLANSITSLSELSAITGLSPQTMGVQPGVEHPFSLRVPRPYAARIQPHNPQDPLLLQVLPRPDEQDITPGYTTDPLDEQHANKIPGLLHKYTGRVLLILTQACAIHCRYCFRQHFPYHGNRLSPEALKNIIQYIQSDPSIYEVILSGGDPLLLKDQALENLVARLSTLPQLRYLRIHTRLPIMIPERITDELIHLLTASPFIATVVLHCNHAQEIDTDVRAAIQKMRDAGIMVLNQSVLLKNINDHADTLIQLSHTLYAAGVLPYYLHLLDSTQGTAHFAISEDTAQQLMETVRSQLPGFLVPRLVKEIPHATSKVPL